jgi:hypothetical protein
VSTVTAFAPSQPGDERHDGEDQPVHRRVVHHASPGRREKHGSHAREDRDREHGLGTRVDVDVVRLSERLEDRPRRGQDARHAAPPRPRRSLACLRERGAAPVGLLDGLDAGALAHAARVRQPEVSSTTRLAKDAQDFPYSHQPWTRGWTRYT